MRRHNLGFFLLSFAWFGCAEPTALRPPARMIAVTPQSVTGVVDTDIVPGAAVRITDEYGQPIRGVEVDFQQQTWHGAVAFIVAHSDAKGLASMGEWKLGRSRGTETVTASSGELAPVVFTAEATPDVPATFIAVAGGNQKGEPRKDLLSPLRARVADRFGNGVAGVTVDFAVVIGGGSIDGLFGSATDAEGVAVANWKLGQVGANSAIATAPGLAPVTYLATAVDLGSDVYELDHIDAKAGPQSPRSKIGLLPNGRFVTYVEGLWGEGTYSIHDGVIDLIYSDDFLPRLTDFDYWVNARSEQGSIEDGVIQIRRCFSDDCLDTVWVYRKLTP